MSLTTGCRLLLAGLALSIGFFIFFYPPSAWQLNSSLRGLSPDFVKDKGVQEALSTLSGSVEKKFFLLLLGDDADSLEEAFEVFQDQLDDNAPFTMADALENIDPYFNLIRQHRFRLMRRDQSGWLEHATKSDLQVYAQSRLYGLEGSAQLLGFTDDPFGFANDFVLTAAGQGWTQGEVNLFTQDGRTHYFVPIALEVQGDALGMETQKSVLKRLSQIKRELKNIAPNLTFLHSGIIFFASDAAQKSKQDIGLIGTGSSIGIVLLLLMVFRTPKALILPLSSVAFGVLFAFTVSHFIYGSVHILTIVFGASLIGVAIDYALHFLYHQSGNRHYKREKELHHALLFSLLSSVIGYAALAMSGLESLRQVAIFSVVGLVGAWLVVLALGPTLTSPHNSGTSPLKSYAAKILALSSTVSLGKFWIACLLTITAFTLMSVKYLVSNDDPRVFFNPSEKLLDEEKRVSELISSYEPGSFLIVKGRSSTQILERLDSIRAILGEQSFHGLFGIHRFVPTPKQQDKAYALNQRLYAIDGNGAAVLEKLGMSKATVDAIREALVQQKSHYILPDAVLASLGENASSLWLTSGDFHYSLILLPRGFATEVLDNLAAQTDGVFFINSAELASQAIGLQRKSASLLVILALGLVAGIVLFRHRQLKYLTLVLVPATAMALTLAILSTLSIAITLFHVMALFLVLGLGMDYVIFVSEISGDKAQTLEAVLLSALTSLLSFGLLSFSSIPVVSAFGLTVFIGNTLNLVGACCIAHYFNTPAPIAPVNDKTTPAQST